MLSQSNKTDMKICLMIVIPSLKALTLSPEEEDKRKKEKEEEKQQHLS